MELSPDDVSALLVVLKDAGVAKFKCALFEVEFPPAELEQTVTLVKAPVPPDPVPPTPYHVAFGGKPPAFKPARRE